MALGVLSVPSPLTIGGTKVVVGGILLLIGYLIKYQQWTWLISETTALVSSDDETAPLVGSLVGNVSVVIGGVLLLIGTVQFLGIVEALPDWILLLLLISATILIAPRLSYNLKSQ